MGVVGEKERDIIIKGQEKMRKDGYKKRKSYCKKGEIVL